MPKKGGLGQFSDLCIMQFQISSRRENRLRDTQVIKIRVLRKVRFWTKRLWVKILLQSLNIANDFIHQFALFHNKMIYTSKDKPKNELYLSTMLITNLCYIYSLFQVIYIVKVLFYMKIAMTNIPCQLPTLKPLNQNM